MLSRWKKRLINLIIQNDPNELVDPWLMDFKWDPRNLPNVRPSHISDVLLREDAACMWESWLVITFTNGLTRSWNACLSDTDGAPPPKEFPWKDFYKWYFCKTTELYTFSAVTPNGFRDTIVRRKDLHVVERTPWKRISRPR